MLVIIKNSLEFGVSIAAEQNHLRLLGGDTFLLGLLLLDFCNLPWAFTMKLHSSVAAAGRGQGQELRLLW